MAADERAEDAALIGLELAGTGLQYADEAHEILKTATSTQRPAGLRDLLWQPADLYPADVLSGMTNSATGAQYEAVMVKDWPRQDFPALAAEVDVPVQFSVAEHERVWRSDPESLADIAAMFTGIAAFRDQRTDRHGAQSQPFGERRGVPHEGAVVRRGMCCRASKHI